MVGRWRDDTGAIYEVVLDDPTEYSCSVSTMHVNGRMQITSGLIRLLEDGRVAWGHHGHFELEPILGSAPLHLCWMTRTGRVWRWSRAGEIDRSDISPLSGEGDNALVAGRSAHPGPRLAPRSARRSEDTGEVQRRSEAAPHFCLFQCDRSGARSWSLEDGRQKRWDVLLHTLLECLMVDDSWPQEICASLFVGADSLQVSGAVQSLAMPEIGQCQDGTPKFRPATIQAWEDLLLTYKGHSTTGLRWRLRPPCGTLYAAQETMLQNLDIELQSAPAGSVAFLLGIGSGPTYEDLKARGLGRRPKARRVFLLLGGATGFDGRGDTDGTFVHEILERCAARLGAAHVTAVALRCVASVSTAQLTVPKLAAFLSTEYSMGALDTAVAGFEAGSEGTTGSRIRVSCHNSKTTGSAHGALTPSLPRRARGGHALSSIRDLTQDFSQRRESRRSDLPTDELKSCKAHSPFARKNVRFGGETVATEGSNDSVNKVFQRTVVGRPTLLKKLPEPPDVEALHSLGPPPRTAPPAPPSSSTEGEVLCRFPTPEPHEPNENENENTYVSADTGGTEGNHYSTVPEKMPMAISDSREDVIVEAIKWDVMSEEMQKPCCQDVVDGLKKATAALGVQAEMETTIEVKQEPETEQSVQDSRKTGWPQLSLPFCSGQILAVQSTNAKEPDTEQSGQNTSTTWWPQFSLPFFLDHLLVQVTKEPTSLDAEVETVDKPAKTRTPKAKAKKQVAAKPRGKAKRSTHERATVEDPWTSLLDVSRDAETSVWPWGLSGVHVFVFVAVAFCTIALVLPVIHSAIKLETTSRYDVDSENLKDLLLSTVDLYEDPWGNFVLMDVDGTVLHISKDQLPAMRMALQEIFDSVETMPFAGRQPSQAWELYEEEVRYQELLRTANHVSDDVWGTPMIVDRDGRAYSPARDRSSRRRNGDGRKGSSLHSSRTSIAEFDDDRPETCASESCRTSFR